MSLPPISRQTHRLSLKEKLDITTNSLQEYEMDQDLCGYRWIKTSVDIASINPSYVCSHQGGFVTPSNI